MPELSQKFLKPYKTKRPPFGPVGEFTYVRTYSRWLETEGRRENWWETVKRVVDYNCAMDLDCAQDEMESLFDAIFHMEVFPAGRQLWIGGTKAVETDGFANFNCAFTTIETLTDFGEVFYLLMVGAGVGISCEHKYYKFLPKVRNFFDVQVKPYQPVAKELRAEYTQYRNQNGYHMIVVGDSKEGWMEALNHFLTIMTSQDDKPIKLFVDNVRPQGERLRTFGGFASGPEPLARMFRKMAIILRSNDGKWTSTKVLDIFNLIEQAVVVGGVRRSAGLAMGDVSDDEFRNAKTNIPALGAELEALDEELLTIRNGPSAVKQRKDLLNRMRALEAKDLSHRFLTNNSLAIYEKPTKEWLEEVFKSILINGEPAFINAAAALVKRADWRGMNPCVEILLRSKGVCNLTEVVCPNAEDLEEAVRHAVRMGLRTTMVNLRFSDWDKTQKQDRLLGVSLTGWQDYASKHKLTLQQKAKLLRKLRRTARSEARTYAFKLRIPEPLLVTTIKPSGTLSKLPGVSSGAHYSYAQYYIQRIRITATDPLLGLMKELGYPIFSEVNQSKVNGETKVIEFPVKSPATTCSDEISAIDQLEEYIILNKNWADHNVSFTCHFKSEEISEIIDWLHKNWDNFVAVSFLPRTEHNYELAPWEEITRAEYQDRIKRLQPFDSALLVQYETSQDHNILDACEAGQCPVR